MYLHANMQPAASWRPVATSGLWILHWILHWTLQWSENNIHLILQGRIKTPTERYCRFNPPLSMWIWLVLNVRQWSSVAFVPLMAAGT